MNIYHTFFKIHRNNIYIFNKLNEWCNFITLFSLHFLLFILDCPFNFTLWQRFYYIFYRENREIIRFFGMVAWNLFFINDILEWFVSFTSHYWNIIYMFRFVDELGKTSSSFFHLWTVTDELSIYSIATILYTNVTRILKN